MCQKIQRKHSSRLCKNMMYNFENCKSNVEIRSGTKLNSTLLHLEIRFYYWKKMEKFSIFYIK